ncbi:ArsR/SmtB family transcription factor [Vibrio hippocampi]|uniref:Biofilm growth-associated repressor n=1 Tax=Vibrio hippocampi TaxID=654686 RepID=A0ABM8ZM32_9VIBR|nr:metalloregulator ArsR/SmtB family transcription factor [Vibrio hippocampi]CAH0529601.1 Biofilm growth-associated repressor [Vibrio hippocampi]
MSIEAMRQRVGDVSETLKVMSHPDRLLVLCQLVEGEVGAGVLQANSQLSQSAFSQHLTVLKKANLVSVRKQSQNVYYSLSDPKVKSLIHHLHSVFCDEESS